MRFKALDRIVSAISGLVMLMLGVGLFVFGVGILPFRLDVSFLDRTFVLWQRAVMVVAAVLLALIGLRAFSLLFRSSKEKGFVLQHTDYGDLSISMSAMENMVRKCVDAHGELKANSIRIHHARDGVIISLRIALANGVNIPIVVNALQKQIKQYITSCSGVDVKEVRVMVETNNSLAPYTGLQSASAMQTDVEAAAKAGAVMESVHEAAQAMLPQETPKDLQHNKEPFHLRLFRREEKPQIVPQPPVNEPTAAAQAVACALEPDVAVDTKEEVPAPQAEATYEPPVADTVPEAADHEENANRTDKEEG